MYRVSCILSSFIIIFFLALTPYLDGSFLDFEAAINRTVGVYVNNERAKDLHLERTLIMTATNFGFLNHLQNFNCFLQRLGLKFLVVAFDEAAHEFISKETSMQSVLWTRTVDKNAVNFGTHGFAVISELKYHAVLEAMKLGYDVIFSDTDVLFLQNPVPYLISQQVDYVHSFNNFCPAPYFNYMLEEGNTGFYYVRSNNRTMKLWSDTLNQASKYPDLDDQSIFWHHILRESSDPIVVSLSRCVLPYSSSGSSSSSSGGGNRHALAVASKHRRMQGQINETSVFVMCALDPCLFTAGILSDPVGGDRPTNLKKQLKLMNIEMPITIHGNFMYGNARKRQRMIEHNLWLFESHDSHVGTHCSNQKIGFDG